MVLLFPYLVVLDDQLVIEYDHFGVKKSIGTNCIDSDLLTGYHNIHIIHILIMINEISQWDKLCLSSYEQHARSIVSLDFDSGEKQLNRQQFLAV
jgi:hypothetical protein